MDANRGKALISTDEMKEVNYVVDEIQESKFISHYFNNNSNLYQVDIRWELGNLLCKSLLDILEIDYDKQTLRVIDLKTTGQSLNHFVRNLLKFGYLTQVAFYTLAVEYWKDNIETQFKEFKVLPPQFIVCETTDKFNNSPRIFSVTESDLQQAIHGGVIRGRWHKGVYELAELYNWHRENNEWSYPKHLCESKGVQVIEDLFDTNHKSYTYEEKEISLNVPFQGRDP
jgi:hypothetical protein